MISSLLRLLRVVFHDLLLIVSERLLCCAYVL